MYLGNVKTDLYIIQQEGKSNEFYVEFLHIYLMANLNLPLQPSIIRILTNIERTMLPPIIVRVFLLIST